MKLSTKGRYGVRAAGELALQYGKGPISLKVIAERQGISEHYLEQLMAEMRKAGLVKSVRGAQGGYILKGEPASITVGDVIRVLEGPFAPVDCVSEDSPENCARENFCMTRKIWARMRDSLAEIVDNITLQDLANDVKSKDKGADPQ